MTKILDIASWPQLAEVLSSIGEGEQIVLTQNGRKVAEVKPLELEESAPSAKRVWGTHPNAISYIADDFDTELPDSFWLGEE